MKAAGAGGERFVGGDSVDIRVGGEGDDVLEAGPGVHVLAGGPRDNIGIQ